MKTTTCGHSHCNGWLHVSRIQSNRVMIHGSYPASGQATPYEGTISQAAKFLRELRNQK